MDLHPWGHQGLPPPGGRRCTGEKEIIEVAAGLAEAGHVGVDGW